MPKHHVLTLLAIAGSVAPVMAQDSTGTAPGLPGDAINPFDANQQVRSYVADLTPFGTSWDTTFGIVPLIKSPQSDAAFFNNLGSANGISDDLLKDVPYASAMYGLWELAPGFGVHPQNNMVPNQINPPGPTGNQFAVGMASTASAGGFSGDNISAAIVNYDPADPNRLYVTRVEAAGTIAGDLSGTSGSVAFGSVDGDGNTYYRGDSFNADGAVSSQVNNNWYRTRAQSRTGVVNLIDGSGGTEVTDHLIVANSTPHPAPSNIPASVSVNNGLVAGANFNSQFVRGETSGTMIANTNHYGVETTFGYTPADHRGSMGTTTRDLFGSGVAHTAVLVKDNGGNTRTLNVWASDAAGAVTEAHSFETPQIVNDPTDGFTKNYTPPGLSEYQQYLGVTGFRSGGGLVSLGQDNAGNGYAGATISAFGISFDLDMQNLVCRFGSNGENPEWTVLGWVDPSGNGKDILDGPGGASIGHLINFQAAFPGAGLLGPSMSTPTFDGAGNAWFIASAALDKIDQDTGEPFIDFDSVLIRGVLTEQEGVGGPSFGYELELVLELGRTFFGQNSGRRWQIQFMELVANSNGSGVLSPGSVDHNNGRSWGWDDGDLSAVDNADPITNGGIVISADIVYDVNEDGVYEDPTGTGNDPASPDQSYQALLYVGYFLDVQGCNAADIAEPFGILDLADISAFIAGFTTADPIADINGDGIFDLSDISDFIAAFTAGCP